MRKLIRMLEFLELELRIRPAGKPPTLEELQEEELADGRCIFACRMELKQKVRASCPGNTAELCIRL